MQPPSSLRRAGLLVLVQGVALAAVGIGYAVSGVVATPQDRLATVLAGVLALLAGLALVAVGRALGVARGWAWSPALVTQVFLVVVGLGMVQGGLWLPAAVLLLPAAGVLSQLASRQAREAYRAQG